MSREMLYIPGATTIGLTFKKGVVLASERRVSYGYFVMSRSGKKVFMINDHVGAACAGLVSDMQILIREVAAYSSLYALEVGRRASVKTTAKIMGNLLFQRRLFPYLTQTIVGGVDEDGKAKLYVLDPLGSVIEDKYATVGSGSEIAIGVLESEYRDGLDEAKALELVKKAMISATSRDVGSGDGMDVLTVTEDGSKETSIPLGK
ncbi:MAG: proteasome subunit beta [Candidatus Bathyarchaeia archaeon]